MSQLGNLASNYHSCKNRSCPKCHTDQTKRWLEARKIETCTRFVTTASGTQLGASTLNEPVSCSCSTSTNAVSSHTIRRDGRPRH